MLQSVQIFRKCFKQLSSSYFIENILKCVPYYLAHLLKGLICINVAFMAFITGDTATMTSFIWRESKLRQYHTNYLRKLVNCHQYYPMSQLLWKLNMKPISSDV